MAIIQKKTIPYDTVAGAVPVTGGGGGGGGAATIADGADVAEGATTDTGVVTDANGTVSAKLRGLIIILLRAFALGTPFRVDPTGTTTQPVSDGGGSLTIDASSLPLPTGAATAAKQPALGTAGSPSTDVITVQGIASGTAQPISAASLPLPTGAATESTLDTRTGSLTETAPATDTASSGINGRLQRVAQRLTTLLAVFPTTIDTNSGNKSASTLRFVLATDQPQLTNKLLVTPDANSAVNVAQINGVTPLMGAGNTGTGSLRVTLATDQAQLTNALKTTFTNKWVAAESIASALTTGLDALGNGNTALSAAIANQTDLYQNILLEVILASVNLSSSTSPYIAIYFLAAADDTNYEDGSAGTPGTIPARSPDAVISLRAVNAAQRVTVSGISIPPQSFKILFVNKAGAALAANTNLLKYRRYNSQAV